MQFAQTQSAEPRTVAGQFEFDEPDKLIVERLNKLLALNAEFSNEKLSYRSENEKNAVALMSQPLDLPTTFSYFGLMLGLFPPAALFLRISFAPTFHGDFGWLVAGWLIVNVITSLVGFYSGKLVANLIRKVENDSWLMMIFVSPFIGIIWGIMSGGLGGVLIFLIGAIFGAVIGGAVGGAALPVFLIAHRLLKKGDFIELKHFLPVAFGITLTICSLILGFSR